MPRCTSCRTVVGADTNFCPKCGAPMAAEAAPPPPVAPTPPPAQPGWGAPQPPAAPAAWGQPPAAPPGQWGAPAPYGTPPKSNNGCLIALAIGGGLVGLVIVGLFIALAVGGTKVAHEVRKVEKSAVATCVGFSYPDQQPLDHCARLGGEVLDFGQTVTASNLRRTPGLAGAAEICADVSYLNRSTDTKDYNRFDWKLQTPSGRVQNFDITGATLGSGQLVSGGRTSGMVCFGDGGEHGDFVLIWKPDAVRPDRGIWLGSL